MKYCRTCKTRAQEDEAVCSRCGEPLALLGGGPSAANAGGGVQAAPQLSLQGEIRQLEAVRNRNRRGSRLLAFVAGLVLVAILTTIYNVYSYTVLSYAVLSNVEVEQDPAAEQLIRISFDVVKPGKVAYDRLSGGERTEKVDLISTTGRQQLAWGWPSSPETGIDFRVVYRRGFTRTSVDRHFAVTGRRSGSMVDIVFLLDTTGSMEPFIKGLKERCIEFAGIVREQGHDCRLGLIGFGDVEIGEAMSVFDPTGELQSFQSAVAAVPRTRGGDNPESSLEAIRRALQMPFREHAALCFVHITDEACHHVDQLPDVALALQLKGIVTYVVSRKDFANLYSPLCVNGGRFFAINEARFDDILINVAKSITSQIRYR
jgi:von Willebrand factor type A domain